jgi:beta-glucosidase/6-phospho-beta-glucosidase/beta-galactosidase
VATSGFQVEGGYTGPGEPANNWAAWERSGRVERSGAANTFWTRPELLLDAAATTGLNAFRLSLEWARLEPRPGEWDGRAAEGYASILAGSRARGLEPVVTLHHFADPAWLDADGWCADGAARFVAHVRRLTREVNEGLLRLGGSPLRLYVTFNEINILAMMSLVLGAFPPGGLGQGPRAARLLDALAAAHVAAYDAIHDVHEERGWPEPTVTINNFAFGLYELDRLILDVLTARQRGVEPGAIVDELPARRSAWYAALDACPRGPHPIDRLLRPALRRLLRDDLPATRAALQTSPRPRKLDAIALDYYDLFPERYLRLPGRRSGLGRAWIPLAALWETPVHPDMLAWTLRQADGYGLPVLVLENGLCSARRGVARTLREDGWTRPRYLRRHILAVLEAIDGGVPVAAYLHWSIADNYEWGTYEPRFGLYGAQAGGAGLEPRDSMADPVAAVYREIVESLRATDVRRRLLAFGL